MLSDTEAGAGMSLKKIKKYPRSQTSQWSYPLTTRAPRQSAADRNEHGFNVLKIDELKACKKIVAHIKVNQILDMMDGLIYDIFYGTFYIRLAIKSNTYSSCLAQLTFPLAFQTDKQHNFCWDVKVRLVSM